jgi:hypothetical protein
MTALMKTKLIKSAQIAGIKRSAAKRKSSKRLLIEQACRAVYALRRPSVDNVLVAGAGQFSRASIEKPERHGAILRCWQKTWDEEHPEEAERRAVRVKTLQAAATINLFHVGEPARSDDLAAALADRDRERNRADRLQAQLREALRHVEGRDNRHAMNVEEIGQLKADLKRARTEPRPRLPKRFSDSTNDTPQH